MRKRTKINVTDKEFTELYQTHSYKELGKHFNCSPMTIWYKVKELNLAKRAGKPKIVLKFKDEV